MAKRLLEALNCEPQETTPLWVMRQAGRYLPEFRAMRKRFSFLELCHQPELVAEVTLMPLKRYDLDAAIIFSDILLLAEALGLGLDYQSGVGPVIARPLRTAADVAALPRPNIREALGYVGEGLRCVKPQLSVPLLGFCGAPFTVASYLIEGGSSRDLKTTKRWMLQDPDSFHQLLTLLTDLSIDYLKMQVDAGADAVQVFESWGNVLAYRQFEEVSIPYLKRIVDAIQPHVPVIVFSRGSAAFVKALAGLQPSCVGVDWNADIAAVAAQLPPNIAVQGNLDPDIMFAPKEILVTEVQRILNAMERCPGHIFNLGHGIKPDTPMEAMEWLVEAVHRGVPSQVSS